MLVRKDHALLAIPRKNKMKNDLRMLSLALCMLPMYLQSARAARCSCAWIAAAPRRHRLARLLPEGQDNSRFAGCGGVGFVKPSPSQPAIHSILEGARRW
jgi:hypothetical protein